MTTDAQLDDLLLRLARQHIQGLETLEKCRSDVPDFHDVAIWSLNDALKVDFAAGGACR